MNRLRECRKNKKLTLKQLSEELAKNNLKISADALGKYERGDREPKLETWIKLADFFDVSVSYLQGVNDDKNIYDFGNIDNLKTAIANGIKFQTGKKYKINDLTFESSNSEEQDNQKFIHDILPALLSNAEMQVFAETYAFMKQKLNYKNSSQKLDEFLMVLVMFMTNNFDRSQTKTALLDFIDAFEADEKKNKSSKKL